MGYRLEMRIFNRLWKMKEFGPVGMRKFPMYGKIKNVPNHQPVIWSTYFLQNIRKTSAPFSGQYGNNCWKKTLGPLNSARRQNKIPRRVRIQLRQSPQKRNGRQFGKPVLAKKTMEIYGIYMRFICLAFFWGILCQPCFGHIIFEAILRLTIPEVMAESCTRWYWLEGIHRKLHIFTKSVYSMKG